MSRSALVAACALAASFLMAETAAAKTVVTGGSVTFELTYDLASSNLWGIPGPGAHPGVINSAGNPVLEFDIQATRKNRNGEWSNGSQVLANGYQLYLNGGIYLFPLDGNGNEIESFAPDTTRLCCRNELSRSGSGPNGFGLNTVIGELFGNINGVRRDDNVLFTLGNAVGDGYELQVTATMAGLLNYAYSEYNSDWFPKEQYDTWVAGGGSPLNLAEGDVVGVVRYNVVTAELPAVPVPAALPLLLGGLGALGVIGRARRKAA
ncbi:PEP-CTERM sorting domain-containing protein [Paenirhodobacter sp.]|uniref:PEP-CTERM sorting domain-containing protein n=1 Tax=Paenirhodobacter sp. TaxID=1965326 RepID=UPI003B3FE83B